MLFKLISFHTASDGGVKPKAPLFIEASTWFNARRVVAGYLEVPVDTVMLTLFDDELPDGADVMDERRPTSVRRITAPMVA